MTTGQRIKAARKKANMTQVDLAVKLGIPYQSIGQWERDIRNPKIETLERIAKELNVSVSYLQGMDAALAELELVGMSIEDVAEEMNIPAERIKEIINYKEPHSAEINEKIIRIAQLLVRETVKNRNEAYMKGPVLRLIGEQNQQRIVTALSQLNAKGQQVAVERIEELTKIPDYQRTEAPEDK